jgi:hypothetical protein
MGGKALLEHLYEGQYPNQTHFCRGCAKQRSLSGQRPCQML